MVPYEPLRDDPFSLRSTGCVQWGIKYGKIMGEASANYDLITVTLPKLGGGIYALRVVLKSYMRFLPQDVFASG